MEDAHVAALLEDLRSQFRVFGEALEGHGAKLDRVAEDVSVLKEDVNEVKVRLTHVEADLSEVNVRLTHVEGDTSETKTRLARIELRMNGAPVPKRRARGK